MTLSKQIQQFSEVHSPAAFQFATENIEANWIDEALKATGTKSIRRRKLPSDVVAWLVIAMALFRDRSIALVVSHLGLALGNDGPAGRGSVVPAAIAQARQRVGPRPIEAIFHKSAKTWSKQLSESERWNGLVVYSVDGTTLNVADTKENHEHFGRPKSGRSISGYPMVRLVALNLPRSHLLVDMNFGPIEKSEYELAEKCWDTIESNSVTIVDRGFLSFGLLHQLHSKKESRHWLVRAKSNTKWRTIRQYGPGDELIELKMNSHARSKDPTLPRTIQARAIRYQCPGFRPQVLLTSLIDPAAFSAEEIVKLYHERWEIELTFDEQKTHMLERNEALRSKKPEGVEQELWGLAIAYNVIRLMMVRVAKEAGVVPRRVSFWGSLLLIRAFAISAWFVPLGNLPRMYHSLLGDMRVMILPERKPRSNPRVVKKKMSSYKKKPAPFHAWGLK